MVTNNEIQEEFDMFAAVWKFYKEVLPVHSDQDDAYWSQMIQRADTICKEFPTNLCRGFVLVILKELERKGKEHDCKITESK